MSNMVLEDRFKEAATIGLAQALNRLCDGGTLRLWDAAGDPLGYYNLCGDEFVAGRDDMSWVVTTRQIGPAKFVQRGVSYKITLATVDLEHVFSLLSDGAIFDDGDSFAPWITISY